MITWDPGGSEAAAYAGGQGILRTREAERASEEIGKQTSSERSETPV